MRKLLIFFIIFLIPFRVFAEKQKIELEYYFEDYKSFAEKFPFLTETGSAKNFKEFEMLPWEKNSAKGLIIGEFEYNGNMYYIVYNYGNASCGSGGCAFEIYSAKDQKTITDDYDFCCEFYLDGDKVYFQNCKGEHIKEYSLQ